MQSKQEAILHVGLVLQDATGQPKMSDLALRLLCEYVSAAAGVDVMR